MIKVEYNGKYPNACRGMLKIWKNNKLIYNKNFCCSSTGGVWFDDDWNEHIVGGKLIWKDIDKFDKEIQKAVKDKLEEIDVCCGGYV